MFSSLGGSDLAAFLEPKINVQANGEKLANLYLQEFSKNMQLVGSNGGDGVITYAKTDWSVNKRAYKHRIIIKQLQGALRNEYWLLFYLPGGPVDLREI
jgi:hypothetical protein